MMRYLNWILILALVPLGFGCSDDDDGSGTGSGGAGSTPPSGEVALTSLGGVVRRATQSGPVAAEGLRVTLDPNGPNERVATTDARGLFLIAGAAPGTYDVLIDGASNPAFELETLQLPWTVKLHGTSSLQPLTLADLMAPETAIGTADVDPAAPGIVTLDVDVFGADPAVAAFVPAGTEIAIDGVLASGPVNLALAEIPGTDLYVRSHTFDADATSLVLLAPRGATFDTNPQSATPQGIALRMPDRRDFGPSGTVDTWYWNEEVEIWQPVQTAAIVNGMVEITDARRGGLYAATRPLAVSCETLLTGRVVTDAGDPLTDVRIGTPFGHSALSDRAGEFTLDRLAGYTHALLPACDAIPFGVAFATDLAAGAQLDEQMPQAIPGDVVDLGDVVFPAPTLGHVTGMTRLDGLPAATSVDIMGPVAFAAVSEADGGFFATDLPPGSYTARTQFSGVSEVSAISFEVVPGHITTVVLEDESDVVARR